MSQCSPLPAQRSGELSPAPALRWEQQPPGEATLRLLLHLRQHSPSSARRDQGGGRRQPEPQVEVARAASRAAQSSRSESQGERKILCKILTVHVFRTKGSKDRMETLHRGAGRSNGTSRSGAGWRLPAHPSCQPSGRASLTSSTQASLPSAHPCQSRGNLVLTDGLLLPLVRSR